MQYLYMNEVEEQIPYYQFPKFLLELPLSQNARIIYLLLYDRARISRKNKWTDENGRVFVVFPLDELSQKTGKCKSSVKKALKELDEAGLLIRRSGGFSRPRHLYVLVPKVDEICNPAQLQPDVKMSAIQAGNEPSFGQKDGCGEGGNVASSKVIEKETISNNYGVRGCSTYGLYKNILLSEEQYAELCKEYPDLIERFMAEMSSYMAVSGKRYKNHAAALKLWAMRDRNGGKVKESEIPDYNCRERESL